MASKKKATFVRHKGVLYQLVAAPAAPKRISFKGAVYEIVAERDPSHLVKLLREKALEEMLGDIEHVTPHRSKRYDPTKQRMRSDEEQQAYEEVQRRMTELEAKKPRKTQEQLVKEVRQEDIEEINFGEEEVPLSQQEREMGFSDEQDIAFRLSKEDYSLLSKLPDAKYGLLREMLNQARGKKLESRSEIWVSDEEIAALKEALSNYLDYSDPSDADAAHASDLLSRYERDYPAKSRRRPKREMPSYEAPPRPKMLTFNYKGATYEIVADDLPRELRMPRKDIHQESEMGPLSRPGPSHDLPRTEDVPEQKKVTRELGKWFEGLRDSDPEAYEKLINDIPDGAVTVNALHDAYHNAPTLSATLDTLNNMVGYINNISRDLTIKLKDQYLNPSMEEVYANLQDPQTAAKVYRALATLIVGTPELVGALENALEVGRSLTNQVTGRGILTERQFKEFKGMLKKVKNEIAQYDPKQRPKIDKPSAKPPSGTPARGKRPKKRSRRPALGKVQKRA